MKQSKDHVSFSLKDPAAGKEAALKRISTSLNKAAQLPFVVVDENYEAIKGLNAIFTTNETVVVKNRTFKVLAVVDGGVLLGPVDTKIIGGETDS